MALSSNENEEVRVFMPQNELKHKAGEGGVDANNVRKAQRRMDESADLFPELAKTEMGRIEQGLDNAQKGKDIDHAKKEIQSAAFELKSNGGMFNYLLVSDVAKNMFDFCDALTQLDATSIKVVEIYYMLLTALIREKDNKKKLEIRMELRSTLETYNRKMLKRILG